MENIRELPFPVRALVHRDPRLIRSSDGKIVMLTILRHLSKSGLTSTIDVMVMMNEGCVYSISALGKQSLGWVDIRYDYEKRGFVIRGGNYNLHVELATRLASAIGLQASEYEVTQNI